MTASRPLGSLLLSLLVAAGCTLGQSDPVDGLVEAAVEGLSEVEDPDGDQGGVGRLLDREGCPLWEEVLVEERAAMGFGDQSVTCWVGPDDGEELSGLVLMAEVVNDSGGSSIAAFREEIQSRGVVRDLAPVRRGAGAPITGWCRSPRDAGGEICAAEYRQDDLRVMLGAVGIRGDDVQTRLDDQLPSVLAQLASLEQ